MTRGNTIYKRETYEVHHRVIAHEGEVVVGVKEMVVGLRERFVGLKKNASEARGTGGGGRRGARQSRAGAHTPSIADGTAEMHLGEEVAATLKTSVSYDMGSFFFS